MKCDDIKVLFVPQYGSLSIERILAKAREDPQLNFYLPEDRDMHKVPQQWLINVAYTIIGESFATWIKESIEQRNEELAKKQKLLIEMDPEIAAAFNSSVNISSKYSLAVMAPFVRALLTYIPCSIQWFQCSPSQSGVETPSHPS